MAAGITIQGGFLFFKDEWPSNWHRSPMTIDGNSYGCVEQWMMAEKARLFGDEAARTAILATDDPREQKRLGREVIGYVEERWAAERYSIVLHGVVEKYRQNDSLRALLLATGQLEFVEASKSDTVWGIGLSRTDPDALRRSMWRGQNLLGKATTEARDMLRAERG